MATRRRPRTAKGRGEVAEINRTLEQLSALDGRKQDVIQLKRDCFQKLIKYMTSGIDMSSVFVPATKCVALSKNDLPLKKMLYLYLRSAARQNSAVSLLVVQTLLTDSKDVDPTVRGLAVRSICSLRVPELLENVFPVVQEALKDSHPYVREVAVLGVLKCHKQDEDKTESVGLIDEVKYMLRTDTDTQVLANCLYVLQQLQGLSQSVLTRQLLISFLNNIRSFSEWGQCLLIDLCLRYYRPTSESERFDVLEVLDFGLNHTNSAVILATAKLFLHFTSNYKEEYDKVISIITGPLRTLMTGREPEIVFAVLCNVRILAERHPDHFYFMAADFFYRPEDPSYLKLLKLDMLVTLSFSGNGFDTAEEVFQYARDRNDDVARHAVRSIARIAMKIEHVDGVLDRLLIFLGHRRNILVGQTIVAFAEALNVFPAAAEVCVPSVLKVELSCLETQESKSAFLWILGQFGELEQEAPYTLEEMVESFQEASNQVKLEFLTAAVKLFCKRPPECLPALKSILGAALVDSSYIVYERASVYSQILSQHGREKMRHVIDPQMEGFARNGAKDTCISDELGDKLFDEWNSLSVVYSAPAVTFLDSDVGAIRRLESGSIGGDIADEILMNDSNEDQNISLLDFAEGDAGAFDSAAKMADVDDFNTHIAGNRDANASTLVNSNSVNDHDRLMVLSDFTDATSISRSQQQQELGDFIDSFGALGQTNEGNGETYAASFELTNPSSFQMSKEDYQSLWSDLEIYSTVLKHPFNSERTVEVIKAEDFRSFASHIGQANLACLDMPSTNSQKPYHYRFYGKDSNSGLLLLLDVLISAIEAKVDIRSENLDLQEHVKGILETLLMTFV